MKQRNKSISRHNIVLVFKEYIEVPVPRGLHETFIFCAADHQVQY